MDRFFCARFFRRAASTILISKAVIHAERRKWQLSAETDEEGDVAHGPELPFGFGALNVWFGSFHISTLTP